MLDLLSFCRQTFCNIRDLVTPTECIICHKKISHTDICDTCLCAMDEDKIDEPLPYAEEYGVNKYNAFYKYESDIVKKALFFMKKNEIDRVFRHFSLRLTGLVRNFDISEECIFVNVPRSKVGLSEYGFDQGELLAKMSARYCDNAKYLRLLKRRGFSDTQKSLKSKERKSNVMGKFKIRRKLIPKDFSHSIVIFDDMCATGSSIKECVKIISSEYPKAKLYAVTIAHTTLK